MSGVSVTVTRSAGDDRAVVVIIDTDFEPDGSNGPGLRILVNNDEGFVGVPYQFGADHEARSVTFDVELDEIDYTGKENS